MPTDDPIVLAQIEMAITTGDVSLLPPPIYQILSEHRGCEITEDGTLVPTCRRDLLPTGMTMDEVMDIAWKLRTHDPRP